MVIVQSKDELIENYTLLEDPVAPNLMIQEYIPGGDDQVYIFNGYFNQDSECLAAFTGYKVRQFPIHVGCASLGDCTWNEEVAHITTDFMKRIGYKGILDIGYRLDPRDDRYKVLDINPRVGQAFRLFIAQNGMDVVRTLYQDMTAQPVYPMKTVEGRRWVIEDFDLISSFHYYKEGTLDLRQWLQSFKGLQEAAWFNRKDLRPFLVMLQALFKRALTWIRKKIFTVPRQCEVQISKLAASNQLSETNPESTNLSASKKSTTKNTNNQQKSDKDNHNLKRAFREDFNEGNLYGKWHNIYNNDDYLSQWASHRMEVVLKSIGEHGLPLTAKALDIGMGSGHLLSELSQRGYEIWGADYAVNIIRNTAQNFASINTNLMNRFLAADVESLPLKQNTFDLVTCLGVLEYVSNVKIALQELYRIIRPGGYLFLAVSSPHRFDSLLSLVKAKLLKSINSRSYRPYEPTTLECSIKLIKPLTLKRLTIEVGFQVHHLKAFGAKVFGRYFPLGLYIPEIIYIGDHCLLVLKKPRKNTQAILGH
jgi:ubiquinone/menaquinone biosynthesis C-methylase UbiE